MARDKTDKTDKTPAATTATSATPSFPEAVTIAREFLSRNDMSELKGMTRLLMVKSMAISAEALHVNEGWIGNRNAFAVKVRDSSLDIPQLVETADWHPLAYEAAGLLAARFLERGDSLPEHLRLWAIEALKGKQAPPMPRNQRRGVRNEDWWHKFYVWQAVFELVELGVNPTRNAASDRLSACDAVASVMKEFGLSPMSYSGVYEVWNAYQGMK